MQAARVNRQTLRDQVVDLIREAILTGVYEPGQRLSEPEVAKQLDVSLTPVREALGVLAASGLVVRNGRQGTHVRVLSVRDVHNLFAVREALECLAVRQAMENLSAEDFARLDAILQRQAESNDLIATARARATRRLVELNDGFHSLILSRSRNEWLEGVLSSIGDLLVFARLQLRETAPMERRVQSLEEHRRIVAALRAGDADAASAAMAEHLRHLEEHVVARMTGDRAGGQVARKPNGEALHVSREDGKP
ncbi:MAG TPA: GntR family transcriptional regulator [Trueperaceae bacterium]